MKATIVFVFVVFLLELAVSFADVDEQAMNEIFAKKSVEEKSAQMFRCEDGYAKTTNIAGDKKEETLVPVAKQ